MLRLLLIRFFLVISRKLRLVKLELSPIEFKIQKLVDDVTDLIPVSTLDLVRQEGLSLGVTELPQLRYQLVHGLIHVTFEVLEMNKGTQLLALYFNQLTTIGYLLCPCSSSSAKTLCRKGSLLSPLGRHQNFRGQSIYERSSFASILCKTSSRSLKEKASR